MSFKPFVTGTAAFGPFKEESDIDIVVSEKDGLKLKKLFENLKIKVKSLQMKKKYDAPTWYINFFGRKINFIMLNTQSDYDDWYIATKSLQKEKPIKLRSERHRKFEYAKTSWIDKKKNEDLAHDIFGGSSIAAPGKYRKRVGEKHDAQD